MMLKRLTLTPAILEQVTRLARAREAFPNDHDSTAQREMEQLRLADLIVDALEQQQAARLASLPVRARGRVQAVTTSASARRQRHA